MSFTVSDQLKVTLFEVKKLRYQSRIIFDYVQPCYSISYVKSGEVITTHEGKEYIARAGDVMIHRPNMPFNVFANIAGIHYLINLDLRVLEAVDFFTLYPLGKVVTLRNPAAYESIFDELRNVWCQETNAYRTVQSSFLTFSLLHEVIESSKSGGHHDADESIIIDRFNRALNYMENNLSEAITRERLAKMYHMNPVYFSRAFKDIYGVTPMQMLKKLRLLRAKRLLESSEISVDQIAQQCGFYDASHFNRTFHKSFSTTPGEYRRKVIGAKLLSLKVSNIQ